VKKPAGKGGRKPVAHTPSQSHDDDADVWEYTAQSIEPLKKAKARFHPAAERAGDPPPRQRAKVETEPAKPKTVRPAAHAHVPPPALPKPKAPPPIAAFDRKKVRKIRSGQVDIEARIDLHGMRQDEAHVALVGFLHRCQKKGQRWVLVITGKGKLSDRDDEAPFDMTRQRERGVLKRNVPRWLDEPELRGLVVSYTTAAIQHGGEGALYVHLRKRG
jgi:DNA-nicking Smr family endonuclease